MEGSDEDNNLMSLEEMNSMGWAFLVMTFLLLGFQKPLGGKDT